MTDDDAKKYAGAIRKDDGTKKKNKHCVGPWLLRGGRPSAEDVKRFRLPLTEVELVRWDQDPEVRQKYASWLEQPAPDAPTDKAAGRKSKTNGDLANLASTIAPDAWPDKARKGKPRATVANARLAITLLG